MGFKGLIASFEPVEREFLQLQRIFSKDSQWRGFHMALGEKSGSSKINVVPRLTVLSSLLELSAAYPGVVAEDVEIRRLDEMFQAATQGLSAPRVLLKMDTQGYDLKVFAGAQNCLGSIQALMSELSVVPGYKDMPHYLESLALYEHAGFKLINLSVVGRTPEGALGDLNCLMQRGSN